MRELIYLFDGSFAGFLCCIFESYDKKEVPTALCGGEEPPLSLFDQRSIRTDPALARRVYRGLYKKDPQAARLIQRAFLCAFPNRNYALYRLCMRVFREGSGFLRNRADPDAYPVLRAVRALSAEAENYRGFVRFSELGGVLGSEIEPKNRVLPIIAPHFCGRHQNERFFIYDRTHREILLYSDGRSRICLLDQFQMAAPDRQEAAFRCLWKRFYDTIAIRERENPRCRMTHMPKRYWNTMTEFQDAEWFRAKEAPADAAVPAVPGGKSEPGIPPGSVPSAPG